MRKPRKLPSMCPGDTDWCPHDGCTTCQGKSYYFKDPNNGAGVTPENRQWVEFIKDE